MSQAADALPCIRAPYADGVVVTATCQHRPIRCPGDGLDETVVCVDGRDWREPCRTPHAHNAVVCAARKVAAVRGEGDGAHFIAVSLRSAKLAANGRVDQMDAASRGP